MTTEAGYDVVVIGGGLLAAAAARDAAQRGLATALFAPEDFGASEGQQSRLAPSILGALETPDFTRVREDSREREILLHMAAPYVQWQPCLVPFYNPGLLAQTRLRASLALADALGFDPLQTFDPAQFQFHPPLRVHQILSVAAAHRHAPCLRTDGLAGAARVWEARVDNPAHLALVTALDARRHGATLHAHKSVREIIQEGSRPGRARVTGIAWQDTLTGTAGHAHARLVILTETLELPLEFPFLPPPPSFRRSVSVSLASKFAETDALALPGDSTLRYLIPAASGSVLGHWESHCREAEGTEDCGLPYATAAEVNALLDSVQPFLPGLTPETVVSAEVRVRTSVLPGQELLDPAGDGARLEGLLTVSGSTLTTARRVAEDAIDLACRKLGRSLALPPCRTAVTPLLPLTDTAALPLPDAVECAVTQEECRTLRDFLTRCSAYNVSEDASILPVVLETMTMLLGWDTDRQARELKAWHAAQALSQTFRVL